MFHRFCSHEFKFARKQQAQCYGQRSAVVVWSTMVFFLLQLFIAMLVRLCFPWFLGF